MPSRTRPSPMPVLAPTPTLALVAVSAAAAAAFVGANDPTMMVWTPKTPYPGPGRHHPITFANETHGFVISGSTESSGAVADMYVYDEARDDWIDASHAVPEAFGPRSLAIGVALSEAPGDPRAYLGFGVDPDGVRLSDLWEFDMSTLEFTRLPDLPGPGRRHPAMNAVRTTAEEGGGGWEIHVGMGDTRVDGSFANLADWWSYGVASKEWTQLPDFPDESGRHHPFHFSIGPKSYAGFGHGSRSPEAPRGVHRDWFVLSDLEPEGRWTWTPMPDLEAVQVGSSGLAGGDGFQPYVASTQGRVAGTQFSIVLPPGGETSTTATERNGGQLVGALGFVLSGDGDTHGTMPTGEFVAFYPGGDESDDGEADEDPWWRMLPPHPGPSRWAPGSFVIRGTARAYFTSGYDRSTGAYHNDVWSIDLSPLFERRQQQEEEEQQQQEEEEESQEEVVEEEQQEEEEEGESEEEDRRTAAAFGFRGTSVLLAATFVAIGLLL